MRSRKDQNKKNCALFQAKIFLVLGSMGLFFTFLYGLNLYPSPVHFGGRRKSLIDVVFQLMELAEHEPLGGMMVLVSVLMLVYGFIQLKRSGWNPRN